MILVVGFLFLADVAIFCIKAMFIVLWNLTLWPIRILASLIK